MWSTAAACCGLDCESTVTRRRLLGGGAQHCTVLLGSRAQGEDTVAYSFQDKYTVAVTFSTFRVDFFVGDDLAVTINRCDGARRNLLALHMHCSHGSALLRRVFAVSAPGLVRNATVLPCPERTSRSRGLLNFEHTREKGENEEEGLWDENWKTHADSKPNGPQSGAYT